jgi:hypothetical protein
MDDQRANREVSSCMRFVKTARLVPLVFLLLAGCSHSLPLDDAENMQVAIWPEKIKCTLSKEQAAKLQSAFAHAVRDTTHKKWSVFGDINYSSGSVEHKASLYEIGEEVGISIDDAGIWRGVSMKEMLDIVRECSKQQPSTPQK